MTEVENAIDIIEGMSFCLYATHNNRCNYTDTGCADCTFMITKNLAIQALQEKAGRDNPKPLTLDELRGMDEEPVWVVAEDKSKWCICNANYGEKFYFTDYDYLRMSKYGATWLAYRYKPKEG